MADKHKKEFAIVKRFVDDDDEVQAYVAIIVTNANDDTTEEEIQDVVERIGFDVYIDTERYEIMDFNKGYKVVSLETLKDETKGWKAMAAYYANEIKIGRCNFLPYVEYVGLFTYDELLDKLDDEKRFTLRLPVGLHTALVKASKGSSLNSYCVKLLSEAVGYKPLAHQAV